MSSGWRRIFAGCASPEAWRNTSRLALLAPAKLHKPSGAKSKRNANANHFPLARKGQHRAALYTAIADQGAPGEETFFTNTMELESLPSSPPWLLWAILIVVIIASLRLARALTVDLFRSDEEELQEYLDEHFPPSNRTPKSNGKGRLSGKFHP